MAKARGMKWKCGVSPAGAEPKICLEGRGITKDESSLEKCVVMCGGSGLEGP